MANKAKHAFGKLENLNSAIEQNLVDSYDILFMKDENDKAVIGWIDAQGNPVIVTDEKADLAELEASVSELEKEVDAKANAEEVDAKVSALEAEVANKVSSEELEAEVSELEAEVAMKANAEEVNAKIDEVDSKIDTVDARIDTAVSDAVTEANAYVDKKVETVVGEAVENAVSDIGVSYEKVKYEIADVPTGTIVKYREDEIRIMCPTDVVFTKQNVGAGGDSNNYYMTLRTYAPSDDVVGYIEHIGDKSDAQVLTDLKIDKYGRKYQPTWLSLARYDETTGVWNYYGESSSIEKYIGWDYRIDWYDANGIMIESDKIRINLSNENCHYVIEPSYVNNVLNNAKAYTDEQIAKSSSTIDIIEF